jgi:Ca2+-binding RTX toxin-like protein
LVGGVVYVTGDQRAGNLDDSITIDRTSQGGVLIHLNAQVAQFAPGQVTGIVIKGGSGNDTINIEQSSITTPVTVYLGDGHDAVNLSPTDQLLGNIQGQITIVGGTGFGTLTLNDQADSGFSTWSIEQSTLRFSQLIQSQFFDTTTINFSNLSGLIINGGSGGASYNIESTLVPTDLHNRGSDTVNVGANGSVQGILGALSVDSSSSMMVDDSADPGARTLTLTSTSIIGLAPAALYYGSGVANLTVAGGSGGNTVQVLSLPANLNNLVLNGGTGNNTLQGPDADSLWTISGPNGGMLSSLTLNANGGTANTLAFQSFQNLQGGSSADVFSFQSGGSLAGKLDGGGGSNTLDYSRYQGDVLVDLLLHGASLVGQTVFSVENVLGSQGNDIFVGDANPNLLVGGSGRNLIIGGGGPDQITGGGGDNILIGGTTVWDANPTALQAIMQEWINTNLTFDQRVNALKKGITVGGRTYALNKSTVFADASIDNLLGGAGWNWFFADFDDVIDNGNGPGVNDRLTRV